MHHIRLILFIPSTIYKNFFPYVTFYATQNKTYLRTNVKINISFWFKKLVLFLKNKKQKERKSKLRCTCKFSSWTHVKINACYRIKLSFLFQTVLSWIKRDFSCLFKLETNSFRRFSVFFFFFLFLFRIFRMSTKIINYL